jgi:hypothetical protein
MSRAEMMRVWMAKKRGTVSVSSGYANCKFVGRWKTLILMLGRFTRDVVGTWELEDATRHFGFIYI